MRGEEKEQSHNGLRHSPKSIGLKRNLDEASPESGVPNVRKIMQSQLSNNFKK